VWHLLLRRRIKTREQRNTRLQLYPKTIPRRRRARPTDILTSRECGSRSTERWEPIPLSASLRGVVGELVRRASGTGLIVNCRFLGDCDRLDAAASQTAYRVVQEALTNAFKHAPGAPVDITIHGEDSGVTVDIVNAAPRESPAALARSGGGYGLAGMLERVHACGGSLTSGPTATGGWQVSSALPAHLSREPGEPVTHDRG